MRDSKSEGLALPRFHQRAFAHNYHAPFIYHIILKKQENCISFGVVKGDARIAPGNNGCAFIEESGLGKIIAKSIVGIQKIFTIIQVYQFIVMPDHVHILLRVKEWSEQHLDFYIDQLVKKITDTYVKTLPSTQEKMLEAQDIFLPGYCDKPLLLKRNLDTLFTYIRENPHRLAMRQQFPHFFRRTRNLIIDNREYEAYGNLFLLRNPDKEAVMISRRFSSEQRAKLEESWLFAAEQGTIIVSPFISKAEKEIRRKAEEKNASIILITHESFPERFKPPAHDFELCSSGRLLIISLKEPPKTPLSRQLCLRMNKLAETIAKL
ncbi:MAG: transposase [Muribaculaceae bacterium]|nr:transposase [Muribaculaceae bacterium]